VVKTHHFITIANGIWRWSRVIAKDKAYADVPITSAYDGGCSFRNLVEEPLADDNAISQGADGRLNAKLSLGELSEIALLFNF